MKKIPTLFKRVYKNNKIVDILPEVNPGFEWVLNGEGIATVKFDGSCCAIIDGIFYKRFDAKPGRKIPEDAMPCCEPDPVTAHWPHWVKIDATNPADKWFLEAVDTYIDRRVSYGDMKLGDKLPDGTYEAIGKHFNGNPYNLAVDTLIMHGAQKIMESDGNARSFDIIKAFLETSNVEGIVFWKDGEPQCKIKRSDFGLPWPVK